MRAQTQRLPTKLAQTPAAVARLQTTPSQKAAPSSPITLTEPSTSWVTLSAQNASTMPRASKPAGGRSPDPEIMGVGPVRNRVGVEIPREQGRATHHERLGARDAGDQAGHHQPAPAIAQEMLDRLAEQRLAGRASLRGRSDPAPPVSRGMRPVRSSR